MMEGVLAPWPGKPEVEALYCHFPRKVAGLTSQPPEDVVRELAMSQLFALASSRTGGWAKQRGVPTREAWGRNGSVR